MAALGSLFAILVLFLAIGAAVPSAAHAAETGTLRLKVVGLPASVQGLVVVRGAGKRDVIRVSTTKALTLPRGRYVVSVRRVTIRHPSSGVTAGSVAYPAKTRMVATLRAGEHKNIFIRYAGIVNSLVRPLPKAALVVGDPTKPRALRLPRGRRPIRRGTIFVSGPTQALPQGLISKVTQVDARHGRYVVRLIPVSVVEAVPKMDFQGELPLTPLNPGWEKAALASVSRTCKPPKLLKFHARLDRAELRHVAISAWPPQMRMTLAARTTESLGLAAAAAGVNCDWKLLELGPYQGAIPIGPVLVPVYATFPVEAGVHINGRLEIGTVNVASTAVATVAAGVQERRASLDLQGTNVWTSGIASITGSAVLKASLGVQAGIGVARGGNLHLQADFGPRFTWSSGAPCKLLFDFGALSAGATLFGKQLSTPSFTPVQANLWSGCQGRMPEGAGSPGGSGRGRDDGSSPPGEGGGALTDAVALGSGSYQTCVVQESSQVACWGANAAISTMSTTPFVHPGVTDAVAITGDLNHFCALLSQGEVRCWGRNDYGQLGDGTEFATWSSSAEVALSEPVVEVANGTFFSCGLVSSGHVYCWGEDEYGQLGDGGSGKSPVPVLVSEISDAVAVAAGTHHACALLANGSIRCWGSNEEGQLGDGTREVRSTPAAVSGVSDAIGIGLGDFHSCAVLASGKAKCWGWAGYGQLGIESPSAYEPTPVEVSGITSAKQIAGGFLNSCALLDDGSITCWGPNDEGQLGDGSKSFSRIPVRVSDITNASVIAMGELHACALTGAGVYCWGSNSYGQLGDNSTNQSSVPVPVFPGVS